MAQERLASFYEYDMGADVVRIGAGPPQEVIRREATAPYTRLCLLEPDAVGWRARLGLADFIEGEGIVDREQPDPMQRRGAAHGIFAACDVLANDFEECAPDLITQIPPGERSTLWLELLRDAPTQRLKVIDAEEASAILDPVSGDECATVVSFAGSDLQIRTMLEKWPTFKSLPLSPPNGEPV